MSSFIFNSRNWSPGAGFADTVSFTTGTFMALQGAAGTQRTNINEVFIQGESTASALSYLTLAHDTTIGVTPATLVTPNSNGALDGTTGALASPVVAAVNFTGTEPQRATTVTLAKVPFSINAFGGVLKWNPWQPNMAFGILGNTQPLGEASLSAFTGSSASAQVSSHIIYETA